jgi:hypothetical protein
MQQLGARTLTVDGVTVFSDHADPNQYWYLPAPVALAKRALDGRPALSMIKFRPAAVAGGAKGGGFATFEVNLKLPEDTERSIKSQLRRLPGVTRAVTLSAIPFDEGTVRCIALDLEGSGGTSAPTNLPTGTFRAVEAIRGAAQPSLAGDNVAAFSLSLTQEGAIILEQAFTKGTTPVGAVYDLKYTILRPALSVVITAKYEDMFQHFSAGLEAQVYWVKAGIDAAFEKFVADGVIDIEVIDFTGEADKDEKEKWALDFFKDNLLSKWFEPSISPADVESRIAKPEGLDAVMKRAREMNPTPAQPGTPGTPGSSQRQNATLIVARSPEPPPAGQNLRLEPGSTGDEEKLIVDGPAGWTATVGGQPATLRDGKIVLNVPGNNTPQTVSVVWPGSGGGTAPVTPRPTTRQFKLFFEKDKPLAAGIAASTLAYVNNTTPDARFKTASGPVGEPPPAGGLQGSALFRAWLDTLADPRNIQFEGNASFEQFPPGQDPLGSPDARERHDFQLSVRRVEVARASMQGKGRFGGMLAKGHSVAKAENRLDNPEDRYVLCTWTGPAAPPPPPPGPATPEVRLTGTIQRAAPVVSPGTPATPGTPGTTPTTPGTPAINVPVPTSMPALVSFKLKFVHKEERKTLTLRYNRTEAVQRSYAPQGFIGLMLGEIDDLSKHFVEVDLDDPFFREFEVVVDAPVDYARIGLNSVQVALDYGSVNDPATLKHADLIFDAATASRASFKAFLSRNRDLGYRASAQFHFDSEQGSGWMGEKLTHEVATFETMDRTLMVNPHAHLGFIEVQVLPNRIDAAMVDRVEVALRFEDPSGWVAEKTLIVRPEGEAQAWKVRTSSPDARTWSYVLTHHLKGGAAPIDDPPVFSTANALPVDDPFPDALEIDLVPMWDPELVRKVLVDVTYVDPANGIDRLERLDIDGTQQDLQRLRMAIRNRQAKAFGWRAKYLMKAGGRVERAAADVTDTLVELLP